MAEYSKNTPPNYGNRPGYGSKARPWWRCYARMIDDDKLKLLSPDDRWQYVALCCLKASGLQDSQCAPELLARRIAVKLGLTVTEASEVKRRLMEVELVDEGWSPVAWDRLQYESDTSTERTRKWREKHKNE